MVLEIAFKLLSDWGYIFTSCSWNTMKQIEIDHSSILLNPSSITYPSATIERVYIALLSKTAYLCIDSYMTLNSKRQPKYVKYQ